MHTKIAITLLVTLLFIAMPESADAKSLEFSGTPVKQLTVADGSWGDKIDCDGGPDPGKGIKYCDASKELGVVVLTAQLTPALMEILGSRNGTLSASQIAELGKSGNPWIIRYCAERGHPDLAELAGRKFFTSDFVQEERVRIAKEGQSMCIQAFKAEAHAFILDRNKLVHIYLTDNRMGDTNSDMDAQQKSLSTQFRSMLSTITWQ